MSVAHIEIRRLAQENAADAALYRDIRLEALRANPEAFGSTFEIENAQTLSWFFDRLGTSTVLGAFCDTKLVAIAGFAIQQGQKRAHKGSLWGMYVRPGQDNEQARRLYASLGFLDYGLEKNALKQDGRYYDDVLMAKNLLGK
jgi:hypothetical protein